MNNNIEETYVSFEVAKLLKEKGFDVHCESYYEEDRSLHQFVGNYNSEDQKKEMPHYSRPTQSICIKWIRENFGIHICTQQTWYANYSKIAYFYLIYKNPGEEVGSNEDRFTNLLEKSYQHVEGKYINEEKFDKFIFEDKFAFLTSEEATEAALLYTLKNLI